MINLRDWQKEATEIWNKTKKGTVEACTGSGKTVFAINIALQEEGNILIVVPTIALLRQWKQEFEKYTDEKIGVFHGEKKDVQRITIGSQNSLWGKRLKECNLLIWDEAHRAQSFNNTEFLIYNNFKKILGLSATPERDDENHNDYFLKIAPIIYRYTQEQAVKDGVISDFDIINIPVPFSDEEFERYQKWDQIARKALSQFIYNYQQMMKASKKGDRVAKEGVFAVNRRKEKIFRSTNKVTKAISLIDQNKHHRIFVFDESVYLVDKLESLLYERGILVGKYHSKMKKARKEKLLQDFSDGKINVMLSCNALEEGIDVAKGDMAIIVNGTSVKRRFIQRIGRVLRKAEGKEKAKIYQLYVPATKDEDWMKKRMS